VGNTVAITDGSETVVNSYDYSPFGMIISESEGFAQPFKFVGKLGVMAEGDFYFMRARYYDPQVGRFISEDPLGFDGGDVNLYVYGGNNPLLVVDPWGLESRPSGREILQSAMNSLPAPEEMMGMLPIGGIKVVGNLLTGFTRHGLAQVISRDAGRGVRASSVLNTLRNPTKIVMQANGTIKYVGRESTVILNKEGKLVTAFGRARQR
jgi:RHS repeat-associated protein